MAPVHSKMGRKLDNAHTYGVLGTLYRKSKNSSPVMNTVCLKQEKQGIGTILQSNDYPPNMRFPRIEYLQRVVTSISDHLREFVRFLTALFLHSPWPLLNEIVTYWTSLLDVPCRHDDLPKRRVHGREGGIFSASGRGKKKSCLHSSYNAESLTYTNNIFKPQEADAFLLGSSLG